MARGVKTLWLLLLGLLLWQPVAEARSYPSAGQIAIVHVAELPPEARETLHKILHGGPFPYRRDGIVFGNYEHRLPRHPRGYYHEYTVKTPGVDNRGPRRIVCGEKLDCYYSGDHYRTFRYIKD